MTHNNDFDLNVVGYLWDEAKTLLEQSGLTVHTKYVGKSPGSGPFRVIRQRSDEKGMAYVTCAREDWYINHS